MLLEDIAWSSAQTNYLTQRHTVFFILSDTSVTCQRLENVSLQIWHIPCLNIFVSKKKSQSHTLCGFKSWSERVVFTDITHPHWSFETFHKAEFVKTLTSSSNSHGQELKYSPPHEKDCMLVKKKKSNKCSFKIRAYSLRQRPFCFVVAWSKDVYHNHVLSWLIKGLLCTVLLSEKRPNQRHTQER